MAEDLSRINPSPPAVAAWGRLKSNQVFSPHEVFKNLDSGFISGAIVSDATIYDLIRAFVSGAGYLKRQ